MKTILSTTIALALACASASTQAATMAPTPEFPLITDTVALKLNGNPWPLYVPTFSYARQGNTFTFELDMGSGFDSGRGDMGNEPIAIGSLPPGTYTARARVTDLASGQTQVTDSYFVVSAPFQPGAYAVPAEPTAHGPWHAVVTSAYYLYPATLRTSVVGNVVKVSFEYEPSASTTGGAGPAGTAAWGSIAVDGLEPGLYTLEFNGTPRGGSAATLQYRKEIAVNGASTVAEYYNETTGHYFITGFPGEMAGLEVPGSQWRRTGEQFRAWLDARRAPAGAVPVCRFHSDALNSHFYTADAGECANLKSIEARESVAGKRYSGWVSEGVAFHALVPVNGACPANTSPVYRFYNNRWRESDSNHRFPTSHGMYRAMGYSSWSSEGIAFCSP
jgi:hypothetical protein